MSDFIDTRESAVLSTNAQVFTGSSVTESIIVSANNGRSAPATASDPVIVDLGKARKKQIRELKRGDGKLMREVSQVMNEVRKALAEEMAGKHLVPVIILYKEKRKRRTMLDSIS